MADVRFDLEKIVGVAVEHAGVEPHHLHQSDRSSAADRLGLEPGIFGEKHTGEQTGWKLKFPRLFHDGASDPVGDLRFGGATKYLRQWQVVVSGNDLAFQRRTVGRQRRSRLDGTGRLARRKALEWRVDLQRGCKEHGSHKARGSQKRQESAAGCRGLA
jgi:hypothetical protein